MFIWAPLSRPAIRVVKTLRGVWLELEEGGVIEPDEVVEELEPLLVDEVPLLVEGLEDVEICVEFVEVEVVVRRPDWVAAFALSLFLLEEVLALVWLALELVWE